MDVAEWTVTFKETSANGYDDIVRKLTKESSINVTIPVGTFDVILEGTIDATIPIPYYGKSSFEITGNETEAVSVPVTVAPKKTEGGKGSFEYTLTVEDLPSNPTLTPVLIPYGASNTPISLDAVLNGNIFTITGSEIPSSFYTFSIKLTADGKTKEIFDRIFWEWIKEEICVPQDFGCETWEELLQECWEDGEWDDVVSYEPIEFEEDKS